MAKFLADIILDQSLDYLRTNGTEMYVCALQPTDRATAISQSLTAAITPSYGANTDGDVSGRKIPVNAVAGEPITTSGTADHIAICSATTLLAVTTLTPQAVSAGGNLDVATFDLELADVV